MDNATASISSTSGTPVVNATSANIAEPAVEEVTTSSSSLLRCLSTDNEALERQKKKRKVIQTCRVSGCSISGERIVNGACPTHYIAIIKKLPCRDWQIITRKVKVQLKFIRSISTTM